MGTHSSLSTVSRVFHALESEYTAWETRPFAEKYASAFVNGTYFTVIYNGEGCKMPILAVVGITLTGEREVLGFSVGGTERIWDVSTEHCITTYSTGPNGRWIRSVVWSPDSQSIAYGEGSGEVQLRRVV